MQTKQEDASRTQVSHSALILVTLKKNHLLHLLLNNVIFILFFQNSKRGNVKKQTFRGKIE